MKQSNFWEERYKQQQTGWDRGDISPNLLYWLENDLLKPCRILIPGCGNGYEVVALAERGFDVVAIDIVQIPIDKLKIELEAKQFRAELVHSDFFTWQCDQPFDAIYEQTSLCALPPDEWNRYENCLYDWLNPAGHLYAQFMQTNKEGGPPYHCELSAMRELFLSHRWNWSIEHKTQIKHSNGLYERTFVLEKTS